ncbi:MAG: YceI family protein [Bacteroidota bacterium]
MKDRAHSGQWHRQQESPVIGVGFTTYNVDVVFDAEDLKSASIKASIDPNSVDTGSEDRDKHVLSPDFFGAAEGDSWTFNSTSISKVGENQYVAAGEMSVKGKTMEMEIPFSFLGEMETRMGHKAGISTEFVIKRSDFGLGGEMGGLIGDEVKMMVFLELNKAE